MEFREFAAAELSVLGRSTSEHGDRIRRDLDTLRRALEAALATVEQTAALPPVPEAVLSGLADSLSSAAAAEVDAATRRALTEGQRALDQALEAARVESERAVLEAVRNVRAESQRALEQALDAAREESEKAVADAIRNTRSEAQRAQDEALEAARAESERATLEAVRSAQAESQRALEKAVSAVRTEMTEKLGKEEQASGSLRQQLKESSAAVAFADAVRREAEAARDKEALLRTTAEGEITAARLRADAAQQELAAARQQLTGLAEQLDAVRREHQAADAEAGSARDALQRRVAELEAAIASAEAAKADAARTHRTQVVRIALEPLEHLRSAFFALNGAKTTEDVLSVLLEALATEFSRVALFDVTANRIEGHRHVGFDAEGGVSKIVVPISVDSPLSNAVRTGRVQGVPARELADPARRLFGGTPTFVLAVPIIVRGQAVAVVYADDSEQADAEFITPERRIKFAEALLWHAIPLLTRLAIEEEAVAELRDYAASVVKDLELVYEANTASHSAAELRVRLQHNLEYARQRFAERIEGEDPSAARLLDEAIARTVHAKHAEPFGRDLGAVSGLQTPVEPGKANKKSQAVASGRA